MGIAEIKELRRWVQLSTGCHNRCHGRVLTKRERVNSSPEGKLINFHKPSQTIRKAIN
jgi:hypothetical protein